MQRLRHVQAGGMRLRSNTMPHEQLALKLARFGDWSSQVALVELRVTGILIALNNHIPVGETPAIECPADVRSRNYELLRGPCARLCDMNVARKVPLWDEETVGRLVALFVPRPVRGPSQNC